MEYFIAHNGIDVFHPGKRLNAQEVSTGQPNLEKFAHRAEFLSRLKELSTEAYDKYMEETNLLAKPE